MRRPFTNNQANERGITDEALEWAVKAGRMQRPFRGVYVKGAGKIQPVERALAAVIGTNGVAAFSLAGILYGLDGISLSCPHVIIPRKSRLLTKQAWIGVIDEDCTELVRNYRCTDGTRTMCDLAAVVDDLVWEQALESALRFELTTIKAIEAEIPRMGAARTPGVARIRRVLALRPPGAPPTGSILETFAIQLIRTDPVLPTPERQVVVENRHGDFVARVDLAYPDYNVFLELDGSGHANQPTYDATRQTAVVAAKKWAPVRFEWDDIVYRRRTTLRRLGEILEV